MAFPKYISPKMQPMDHMSTALVYLLDPKSISGALYHLVATYYVMIGSVTDWFIDAIDLASPKSASLARQSESNKIFDGFRSLWINYPECMYLIPFKTLKIKQNLLIHNIFFVHVFHDISPDDCMQICLHKIKNEVNIFIIFCF